MTLQHYQCTLRNSDDTFTKTYLDTWKFRVLSTPPNYSKMTKSWNPFIKRPPNQTQSDESFQQSQPKPSNQLKKGPMHFVNTTDDHGIGHSMKLVNWSKTSMCEINVVFLGWTIGQFPLHLTSHMANQFTFVIVSLHQLKPGGIFTFQLYIGHGDLLPFLQCTGFLYFVRFLCFILVFSQFHFPFTPVYPRVRPKPESVHCCCT